MAQLRATTESSVHPSTVSSQFRVDTAAKLLPKLVSEQETETFLIAFENIAHLNKWPPDKWASVLQTQLKGEGLTVFSELGAEDCQDYGKLKKAILLAYELCPEVYRKRFRLSNKLATETHAEFALHGVTTWNDIELLRETFLMEQFMESILLELRLWLI